MAEDDKKSTFPVIPSAHWWALRKKFNQSIPGVVTDNYIASVLDMQLSSARANVLPALKATKIIDSDGKPLDRAKRWRDDNQYGTVCDEIRKDVYPTELLEGIPDPSANRSAAERWFANHTGAGEAAVRKMAQFYVLLSDADATRVPEGKSDSTVNSKPKDGRAPRHRQAGKTPKQREPEVTTHAPQVNSSTPEGPSVHINLQIHISADASTDQIEQVFASMAKHIYKSGTSE